jgi:hypothetical protein
LGNFDTPVKAAIAYDEAARLIPGRQLNFLQESSVGGDGNAIASLVVPSAPSSAVSTEVPTEGKTLIHWSVRNMCSLFKMNAYSIVQIYTF